MDRESDNRETDLLAGAEPALDLQSRQVHSRLPLQFTELAGRAAGCEDRLRTRTIELDDLRRVPTEGRLFMLKLDGVALSRVSGDQPRALYCPTPSGVITIARKTAGPASSQSEEAGVDEYTMGFSSDAEQSQSISISVPIELWDDEAHWLAPAPMLVVNGVSRQAPGLQWTDEFIQSVEWVCDGLLRRPKGARPGVLRQVEEALLRCFERFGAPLERVAVDRASRSARGEAVERARRYIHENLTQQIRLPDVCRHSRMQARSLEYGFRELMGISPMSYLKLLRLQRARRLLRSAVDSQHSVSQIALDCGFWHLSQFASDYKRLFRESPSITRNRTLAETVPAERHARRFAFA